MTFGGCPANSPPGNANYLNCSLLNQGELIQNYYSTSHVSLGNYIAEVSGQETNPTLNSDCVDAASLAHPPVVGHFTDVTPGTDADTTANPQYAGAIPAGAPSSDFFYPGYPTSEPPAYTLPGGGQVGTVVLNKRLIVPGTVNTTGYYNHYSALRSYEHLLGLTKGGDDGYGHLGYAGTAGMLPFGKDVFNAKTW